MPHRTAPDLTVPNPGKPEPAKTQPAELHHAAPPTHVVAIELLRWRPTP